MKSGVLSSFLGSWSPEFYGGKHVKALEKAFEKKYNVKYALAVNSWTSGLICAVGALDIEPGDEIILTPFTMCACASAILHWNAIPVFADIVPSDPDMASHIASLRAPYEAECNRIIGKAETLLYRRGNFNGSWDDIICDAIMAERDTEIALSPGFRWGTTLLPGQDITIDDLYTQTSMSYPEVYRTEMSGQMLKDILEDVCDNLFNIDPFFQQGGDMVRVGGFSYTCEPKEQMGSRISDMRLISSGQLIESDRKYVVGGWASVSEDVEGPAIYDLVENYITKQGQVAPKHPGNVRVIGM